ncbi:MAG: enoyl-CoA hydratase-related protein [Pseudomonadota bacterium]
MTASLLCNTDARGVATLTLHRPARRNALDGKLMAALSKHLSVLADDPVTRVVVLTGSGQAFCSGADLAWVAQVVAAGATANRADASQLAGLMHQLNTFPRPTLARVNGAAWGGGIGLIACCDLAIASSAATFAFSEVRLGLVAAVIAPYVLAAIGPRQARHFLLTGERFSSQQAMAMGLVCQVVTEVELDTAVEMQLTRLLQGEPHAQAETKRLLQRLVDGNREFLQQTADLTARLRATAAAQQRMQVFLKRHKASQDA